MRINFNNNCNYKPRAFCGTNTIIKTITKTQETSFEADCRLLNKITTKLNQLSNENNLNFIIPTPHTIPSHQHAQWVQGNDKFGLEFQAQNKPKGAFMWDKMAGYILYKESIGNTVRSTKINVVKENTKEIAKLVNVLTNNIKNDVANITKTYSKSYENSILQDILRIDLAKSKDFKPHAYEPLTEKNGLAYGKKVVESPPTAEEDLPF